LIVGASGTGKTSLAKRLAETRQTSRQYVNGFRQVALDPLGSQWPQSVAVVDNWDDLETELQVMNEAGEVGCVYIDEANIHFSLADKEKLWLMLRGRHLGLDVTLITQYPTLLSPAARGQCEKLHLFQIGAQSARMLAEDYAAPELMQASGLKRGEWLCVEWDSAGHRKVNKYLLFDCTKKA
jgi:Cdc6-like AAA superfamily ATPase